MRKAIMLSTLLAIMCSFSKPQLSMGELMEGNSFHCYMVEYPDSTTYHFTSSDLLNHVIGGYGSTNPSAFDLDGSGVVNTTDVTLAVGGYGNPESSTLPDFYDFVPNGNFGEGNTWMSYTGENPTVSFGWLHRTPFDESNPANYIGYDNIFTYTFDLITDGGVIYYHYVSH